MKPQKPPSIKEPAVLILGLALSILSAAICMQIMGQFGTTPNTSLIGVALVIIIARIPLAVAQKFRDAERQNYVLSITSAAGFTAANCGFIAVATMIMMGRNDLIIPISIGALIGSMITVFVTGKLFDSKIFPAKGAWPMGQAVATAIQAGEAGGEKGLHLLQGLAVGAAAGFFGIPAAGVGIAFIANSFTIAALGAGMILRGFSTQIFAGFDIGGSNIAQGAMIGAGIVALIQIALALLKSNKKKTEEQDFTVPDVRAFRWMGGFALLYMGGAVALALITIQFDGMAMSLGQTVLWVAFSGIAAVVVLVLVGTSAMHSGWAPNFAVVTIFLTLGVLIGFPPVPLAVLVGYIGCVGLCLSDTGIGLKTGWIIRGKGADPAREARGRRQQVIIKQLGVLIGILVALISASLLIDGGITPPMSIFYASAVEMTAQPELVTELMLWAIPGAALQLAFGSKSVGLMLAAGLLINNGLYGIVLLAAIGLKLIIGTKHMTIRGSGLIAGDGLFGFAANLLRAFF